MIFLCVLLISTWQLSTATIIIETGPVTSGVEMSLKEWYGESPFSIMAVHVAEFTVTTGDNKCQMVTTAVTAALARKKHVGLLTEDQECRALERFQACHGKLCNNSAMLDAFLEPQTFREQVDLLIAISKLGDILRGKEDGEILLNLLVDGELKAILSEVPYPPKFTDDNLSAGLAPYMDVAFKMLQTACNPGILVAGPLDLPAITEVLVSSLNDRYTHNAVSAAEVGKVWTMETMEEYHNLWREIADKVASPTSALAKTCLDPAVAYYNYEKISIARIRQIAIAAGMCVSEEESSSMSDSDNVPPIVKDYAASMPIDPPMYEYMEAAAPPPPMHYDDGPPVDSGSSPGSAPAMPAPSFNGPPV